MKSRILFAFILSCHLCIGAVENSIIPLMEKFERVENLPKQKHSRLQYEEISAALSRKEERIRFVTYNMLMDDYDKDLDQENRWSQRLPRIVELLEEMQPDIIAVQELSLNQYEGLKQHLEAFSFYSRECVDGELNGIFYRKERFERIESQVWYMTPDGPLTMVQLKDLKTDQQFAVFNTHLAFSKVDKRDFQARFIAEKVEEFAKAMPVLLAGDLNTFPHRLELKKLPFYDGSYIHRILTKGALKDSQELALLGNLGPLSTFSNAGEDPTAFKGTGTPGVFLDHIYVSKGIQVLMHGVQPGTVNGHFPSDHLPVLIDFIIN